MTSVKPDDNQLALDELKQKLMSSGTTDLGLMSFSIEQTAALSTVGRDGVYRAIRERKLQAKKYGRRTLIPAASLKRFIAELPDFQPQTL